MYANTLCNVIMCISVSGEHKYKHVTSLLYQKRKQNICVHFTSFCYIKKKEVRRFILWQMLSKV